MLPEVTPPEITWPKVTWSAMTRSHDSHVFGSDVITGSDITGGDVIFPRFFLTIVVAQNVPLLFIIRFTVSDYSFGIIWSLCCLSFDIQLIIIPLVFSSFPCKGKFCTTTIVRKKRGKMTSPPVMTSRPVTRLTSLPVTADHVISGGVTSSSTPFPNYDGLHWSSKQSSTDQTPNMRLPHYSE